MSEPGTIKCDLCGSRVPVANLTTHALQCARNAGRRGLGSPRRDNTPPAPSSPPREKSPSGSPLPPLAPLSQARSPSPLPESPQRRDATPPPIPSIVGRPARRTAPQAEEDEIMEYVPTPPRRAAPPPAAGSRQHLEDLLQQVIEVVGTEMASREAILQDLAVTGDAPSTINNVFDGTLYAPPAEDEDRARPSPVAASPPPAYQSSPQRSPSPEYHPVAKAKTAPKRPAIFGEDKSDSDDGLVNRRLSREKPAPPKTVTSTADGAARLTLEQRRAAVPAFISLDADDDWLFEESQKPDGDPASHSPSPAKKPAGRGAADGASRKAPAKGAGAPGKVAHTPEGRKRLQKALARFSSVATDKTEELDEQPSPLARSHRHGADEDTGRAADGGREDVVDLVTPEGSPVPQRKCPTAAAAKHARALGDDDSDRPKKKAAKRRRDSDKSSNASDGEPLPDIPDRPAKKKRAAAKKPVARGSGDEEAAEKPPKKKRVPAETKVAIAQKKKLERQLSKLNAVKRTMSAAAAAPEICVILDTRLAQNSPEVVKMIKAIGCQVETKDNSIVESILWARIKTEHFLDEGSQSIDSRSHQVQENYLAVRIMTPRFLEMLNRNEYRSFFTRLRTRYPNDPILSIIIEGLPTYLADEYKKSEKAYRQIVMGNDSEHIDRADNATLWQRVQEATVWMELEGRCTVYQTQDVVHTASLLAQLSACIAREPYRQHSVAGASFHHGGVKERSNGLRQSWTAMLSKIGSVSRGMAEGVVERYPTMQSLLAVYNDPGLSVGQKQSLLVGISGPTGGSIGQALSGKIYTLLNGRDPSIKFH